MATEYQSPDSGRRWSVDHVLSVSSIVISAAVAIVFGYSTITSEHVNRERESVVDGAQTEAAFVQACLEYETFVIDQYRAGLTEDQIQDLIPVGLLVLQTGYYRTAQTCPAVSEIIGTLELPPN